MKEKEKNQWTELNYLFKRQEDVYRGIAFKEGFSDSVFDVLYALWDIGGGCTQKEISEVYYIKKQTLNSSVKNLEKEGILLLEKGKSGNKKIFLTEKGRELVKNKIVPVSEAEEKAFLGLSEEERSLLLGLFSKYADSLESAVNEIFEKEKIL